MAPTVDATTRGPILDGLAHGESRPALSVEARTSLPTRYGRFEVLAFTAGGDPTPHVALVLGDPRGHDVLTRVHSECLTGEVLGSLKCDCGEQLDTALSRIAAEGRGIVVYLRGQEGRGIGLVNKLRAYALQDEHGLDTIDANLALGHPADGRDYRPAAAILRHLGVRVVTLMTNNNDKARALTNAGFRVRVDTMCATVTPHNEAYLRTKVERFGHKGVWAPIAAVPDIA